MTNNSIDKTSVLCYNVFHVKEVYIMAGLFVHKRGNKWEYRFEVASVDGKRKFVQKSGFATKKDAIAVGTDAMNRYNGTGIIFQPSEIGFADFILEWLESIKLTVKPTTYTNYQKKINNHIIPSLGRYKLKSITSPMLQKLINDMYENEYSRNSLSVVKGILSSSLDYAVEPMHYITSNPMSHVKLPSTRIHTAKSRQSPHVYISKEDMEIIFQRFPEKSTAHIPLMLGYKCGLRLGEAFGLWWEDIDLDNKTISVKRQIQWKEKDKSDSSSESYWYFTAPKYESYRTITIDDKLCDLLKREKARQEKAKAYYDDLYCHNYMDDTNRLNQEGRGSEINLLCLEECGKYSQPRIMQHTSAVINKTLGIKFDFHSLRHTHCSMLLESGVKPKYVQERLGHKNIQVTLNIYQHLTDSMQSDGDDIVNNMF